MEDYRKQIRIRRQELGLTQKEVEELLGMDNYDAIQAYRASLGNQDEINRFDQVFGGIMDKFRDGQDEEARRDLRSMLYSNRSTTGELLPDFASWMDVLTNESMTESKQASTRQ